MGTADDGESRGSGGRHDDGENTTNQQKGLGERSGRAVGLLGFK